MIFNQYDDASIYQNKAEILYHLNIFKQNNIFYSTHAGVSMYKYTTQIYME